METVQTAEGRVRLRAENVGGIDDTEVEFHPGVNLLTGWNASNRTSLLQAIMAAVGSNRASLKGDADRGRVEMEFDGETYIRTLERRDGEVAFEGSPYDDDPALADLFAFLLESNETRRAVARGDDLREIIMRPVDTEAIHDEIEKLEARKREIESELEERDRLADQRQSLEEKRADLERRIDEKHEALEVKREEIAAADAELEETRERKAELESKLSALQEKRSTLEDVRFRLETERESVEVIREDLADVEAELEERSAIPDAEIEALEDRSASLRKRKRTLDSKINQLQSLIQFNEEVLDSEGVSVLDELGFDAGVSNDVTSGLLPEGESFACWTCGQKATHADIEEMLETLREQRSDLVEKRRETIADLDETKEERAELDEREQRLDELDRRREDLEAECREAEDEIETLEGRREELVDEINLLEKEVESLRESEYDEIVDLHKEANALEIEVDQLESDLDRLTEQLRSTRERIEELEDLDAEREEIGTQLEDARTRIERLEDEAIEAFNEHMATVLSVLEYENIERIWLERVEKKVRDGRRKVTRGFFDLHVVRSTEDGTVYEDTVAHLSESEREVTGLVFALAGYLVHDVHKEVPFMLLDSIEAIDANRIAALVDYVADYPDYLVVALLPEDAEAVDDRYHRITEI